MPIDDSDSTDPEVATVPTGVKIQSEQTEARRPIAVWIWVAALTAGLAAGFGSWFLDEPLHGRYQPELIKSKGFPTLEQSNANALRMHAAVTFEASLIFATLGAVLGLWLGLAGGVARGSAAGAATAGVVGLVLGGLCGFATTNLFMKAYYYLYVHDDSDLGLAVLIQGGIAAVVGAVAGGAFGLGLAEGGRRLDMRFVTGGLLGAFIGLVIYQMVGGIAFPLDGTASPVAYNRLARLYVHVSIAGCAAIGVALAQGFTVARPTPTPTPAARPD
jgi:hypothetical protein